MNRNMNHSFAISFLSLYLYLNLYEYCMSPSERHLGSRVSGRRGGEHEAGRRGGEAKSVLEIVVRIPLLISADSQADSRSPFPA